jgi:hypothetical protein
MAGKIRAAPEAALSANADFIRAEIFCRSGGQSLTKFSAKPHGPAIDRSAEPAIRRE